MKKEKLEEISNEEYLDEDTKKMKKKFKLFNKFIIILEGLMLVPIGVALIMIILSTIICITNNNSNFFDVLFTEI